MKTLIALQIIFVLLSIFEAVRAVLCFVADDFSQAKVASLLMLICLWMAFDRIPAKKRRLKRHPLKEPIPSSNTSPSTADEMRMLASEVRAKRPVPTLDEVLDQICVSTARGCHCIVVWNGPSDETKETLRKGGFQVSDDPAVYRGGSYIGW